MPFYGGGGGGGGGSMEAGLVWKGEWSMEGTYVVNDIVTEEGITYVCTEDDPGLPPSLLDGWDVLAGSASEVAARQTVTFTSASLEPAARGTGTVDIGKTYLLLGVELSDPARVRLYVNATSQTADASRPRGTDPDTAKNPGIVFDFAIENPADVAEPTALTPMVLGATDTGISVPITVDNLGSATEAITITLTYLRTE